MGRGNIGLVGFFRCTTTRRMVGTGNGQSKPQCFSSFPLYITYSIVLGMLVVFNHPKLSARYYQFLDAETFQVKKNLEDDLIDACIHCTLYHLHRITFVTFFNFIYMVRSVLLISESYG